MDVVIPALLIFSKLEKKILVNYWKRWGKAKVMKLIVTELD